ncbi:putative Polyadenylate-binding protein [Blattamonas nauphoetae]|uniref:Polyadenylate-binding protein n=1 Tax=Blattamonas nauphoetae TaxID=2049346 RepID=A0ABQ9XWK0_9EUKA|nr:putative Polyadenylate-binding protein [Blattamonas nauphoetae]
MPPTPSKRGKGKKPWRQNEASFDKTNLYVRDIPLSYTDSKLHLLFSQHGKVVSAKIMVDRKGNSLQFGFVRFENEIDAEKALKNVNRQEVEGQILFVKYSNKTSSEKTLPPNVNLYVKPLPESYTEDDLKQLFSPFGPVEESKILMDFETGKSRQIGFVKMKTMNAAVNAQSQMNGIKITELSPQLTVRFAEPKKFSDKPQDQMLDSRSASASPDPSLVPSPPIAPDPIQMQKLINAKPFVSKRRSPPPSVPISYPTSPAQGIISPQPLDQSISTVLYSSSHHVSPHPQTPGPTTPPTPRILFFSQRDHPVNAIDNHPPAASTISNSLYIPPYQNLDASTTASFPFQADPSVSTSIVWESKPLNPPEQVLFRSPDLALPKQPAAQPPSSNILFTSSQFPLSSLPPSHPSSSPSYSHDHSETKSDSFTEDRTTFLSTDQSSLFSSSTFFDGSIPSHLRLSFFPSMSQSSSISIGSSISSSLFSGSQMSESVLPDFSMSFGGST